MSDTPVTYSDVERVIENILSAGILPSLATIQRAFDKEQYSEVIKHFEKWKASSGWETQFNQSGDVNTLIDYIKEKEDKFEYTLSLVRATLESTNDSIVVNSNDGQIIDYNEKFIKLWNIPREILESRDEAESRERGIINQLSNPEEIISETQKIMQDKDASGICADLHFKDGRICERYSQPYRVNDEVVGRVWCMRDVTEKRKAEESMKLYQRAIEASPDGILVIDVKESTDLTILYANPAFKDVTGYVPDEIQGKSFELLYGQDSEQKEIKKIEHAIKNGQEEKIVMRNYRADGSMFWGEIHLAPVFQVVKDIDTHGGKTLIADDRVEVGKTLEHYVVVIVDVTERKAMEKQLTYQATHDSLTNLPNRLLLNDRLSQELSHADRENRFMAVLYIDLDHFKFVNDGLGHSVGDALLKSVAERISSCLGDKDTISRIGGDEFIVILPGLNKEQEALVVVEKIINELRQIFVLEEQELNVSASIGAAIYPRDGKDVETLIRNADTAMYKAKDQGRDGFQFYSREMNQNATRRLTLQNQLSRALERNELQLFYQGQVDLQSNRFIGVEALLRWHNKELGNISPVEFIPVAEETGLIVSIGQWIIETAFNQKKQWEESGLETIQMSVNLSGRQLLFPELNDFINNSVKKLGLNPKHLVLEITESMLMDRSERSLQILYMLRENGMKIAIDDFGTGYSSLSYLKDLPVDKLKIDRSFVKNINESESDKAITLAIIAMAKKLGLKVIAEGAETEAEVNFLRDNQCDEVQGYYFSKPLPSDEIEALIRSRNEAN